VVFLSSRAVYDGLAAEKTLTEEQSLEPSSLYGEVKLLPSGCWPICRPRFVTSSLRVTGVYGDTRPNKWDALFSDYLAGREVPQRAGSEVMAVTWGGRAAHAVHRSARVSGQSFNVSDIVVDNHDILDIFQSVPDCPQRLPRRGTRRLSGQCRWRDHRAWLEAGRAGSVREYGSLTGRQLLKSLSPRGRNTYSALE